MRAFVRKALRENDAGQSKMENVLSYIATNFRNQQEIKGQSRHFEHEQRGTFPCMDHCEQCTRSILEAKSGTAGTSATDTIRVATPCAWADPRLRQRNW